VQERQFPPSESEELVPAERAALTRVRTRRVQRLGAGAGAALLAFLALGCPEGADLEIPPGGFPKPGYSTGGAATAGGAAGGADTGAACEVQCVKDIFQKSPTLCALCHNNNPDMTKLTSAMLDLKSDGFTARLKDVPATHTEIAPPMTNANCPKGDKLIDTSTPSASWLLKKIENQQGDCGTVMPSTSALSMAQKSCLETYVACVAGGPITGGGGAATGAAGAASGGGGAAASGGGSAGAATGGGGTATGGGGSGGRAGFGGRGGRGGTGGA
jgi:hypothetical protein